MDSECLTTIARSICMILHIRGVRVIEQVKRCSQASVHITIPERLSERGKCRFSRAVSWCNVLHFERVVQGCGHLLYVRITRHYEVKPTSHDVDVRVYRGRCGNDLVDAGM